MVSAFKHVWADSWGPRLEYILLNSLRLLLDAPGTSLLGLPRLLVDKTYRNRLLKTCRDPLVRSFWERELAAWGKQFEAEALSPVQNKVGTLLSPPILRNIIGQPRPTIDIPRMINSRQIFIANLSKAAIGEGPAHLLGAFLATSFAQAAQARASIPEKERQDFTLYVDEVHNFATHSFASILSEARKYRLSLVLAHQYLGQLPVDLRQAIMANAGTIVSFRLGADDAEVLAPQFASLKVRPGDLTDLSNFTAWARIMCNNEPAGPHELSTIRPEPAHKDRTRRVVAQTRVRYTRRRAMVEKKIARFYKSDDRQSKKKKAAL
jgi:hypothetical protein